MLIETPNWIADYKKPRTTDVVIYTTLSFGHPKIFAVRKEYLCGHLLVHQLNEPYTEKEQLALLKDVKETKCPTCI